MGRLFGTDGIRGIANTELSCELAMKIGRSAAIVLPQELSGRPKVLIGMDTRISSEMLEAALAAGLCSVGVDVLLLGVVPTPAVAFLVKKYGYDAGVMISASHNPCEYNGIKIFRSDGYKLPDELEDALKSSFWMKPRPPCLVGKDVGRITGQKWRCLIIWSILCPPWTMVLRVCDRARLRERVRECDRARTVYAPRRGLRSAVL
jgi:phosphoglucosamine mutase